MHAPARCPGLLAAAFAVLLALPLLTLPLGDPSVPGAEAEAAFPAFNVRALLDGSWQGGVERWYERNFGLRRYWVRTANQVQFTLFSEIPWKTGQEIVQGKGHTLYQAVYLKALTGLDEVPPARLEAFARNLRRVQDLLKERGLPFLFLVTPSKAVLEPEELPPLPGPVRPINIERLLPLLGRHGINHLDTRPIAWELKARTGRPVFPKGGIHWNQELGLLATQAMIERLESLLGKRLIRLRYTEPAPMGPPQKGDADLANIANLWWNGSFHQLVSQPRIEVDRPSGDIFRPKLYLVGGSFIRMPMKLLLSHGVMEASSPLNFYGSDPVPDLAGYDAVVLETNEGWIPGLGFNFLERILAGEPARGPR